MNNILFSAFDLADHFIKKIKASDHERILLLTELMMSHLLSNWQTEDMTDVEWRFENYARDVFETIETNHSGLYASVYLTGTSSDELRPLIRTIIPEISESEFEEAVELVMKLTSATSFDVFDQYERKDWSMSILICVFCLIIAAATVWLYFHALGEDAKQASNLAEGATRQSQENQAWAKKLLVTIHRHWKWNNDFRKIQFSEKERRLVVQYLAQQAGFHEAIPKRGDIFNGNEMECLGRLDKYVYSTEISGIHADAYGQLIQPLVLCASADFITAENLSDDRILRYLQKYDLDNYKSYACVFTKKICSKMEFFFGDNLDAFLKKLCEKSLDKTLKILLINTGDDFNSQTMFPEQEPVPESAVVQDIRHHALVRDHEILLQALVTVKSNEVI